jgi:hypothetical protein
MKKNRRAANAEPPTSIEGNEPNQRQIAVRAYELFLSRGEIHGRDLDDWLAAERELMGQRQPAGARRP